MRKNLYVLPLLALISSLSIAQFSFVSNRKLASSSVTTGTLAPVGDAYTRNGTYANTNYGTTSTFIVKTTTQSGVARASYLKFSLSTIAGPISSAKLRIYGRCTEAGSVAKTGVYGINDDAWTETAITWNNAPANITGLLTSADVSDQNKYWELDVTAFVQTELAGDKTASFLVKSPTNINKYLEFNSKEKSTNRPQLVITTDATSTNQAPVLAAIGDKTAALGQPLTFTASASDADAGQHLSFSLVGAPDGATIDASTGAFSWTPTTSGTYTFTVQVSDDGSPVLTDAEQITVTVADGAPTNQAPVLSPIGNKVITVGQALTFTASASDADADQTLTFSLVDALTGASIDPTTGAFSWTPAAAGTYTFSVRVTDNGSPALSDAEQISVTASSSVTTGTLAPVGDAYTRNGTYANTNYGTTSTFIVKTTTQSGVARASYLKFSLSTIAGPISSAKLRIYGRCTEAGSVAKTGVYGINDDAWTETAITWNNAPANITGLLTSADVSDQNKYWELDVTAFVQTELAGDKTASFLVKSPTNINKYLEFNSKEKSTNRPQLVITTDATSTNQAPVLAAIGDKTAALGQPLTFTASASDADAGQHLSFSLVGAPDGATIDASTGAFSWTPTTSGTYTFTVQVSDDGSPVLTDAEQITVTVADPKFTNTNKISIPNPGTVSVPVVVSGISDHIDTTTFGLQSVVVNITHPNLKELTLQLQSPDGKVIYLSRKSPGINYNTTFDGVSDKFIDLNEIKATYTGSYTTGYRPRQDLALLNNGQNPNGTWNLIVTDDASASTAGTVTNVAIVFGTKPAKPLLSSSSLPIVKIYTDNGADILDDPKIPGDMFIINNGPGAYNSVNQNSYYYQGRIGIEIRGNSTSHDPQIPKKQYGFETKTPDGASSLDTSIMGMPKQSDWILSAVMSDKSLLRNVLTYQMAREMGWWASRTQFCELIINDEYRGVFIFEEKIKKDKNRVDIEKMGAADITAPNVTGGYIFQLDDIDPPSNTWQTKIEPKFSPFQLVYPKYEDAQPAQVTYINSYVDSFEAALNGPDFQDPVNGFRRFANDSSFIDFFIISEVAKNLDSYRYSTYFYKKRNGKIVAMPVWDFDRAYRNDSACLTYTTTGYIYKDVNGCEGRVVPWWWARLLQDTKYKQDVVCRYNKLRQTTLSLQHLYYLIDSSAAVLNAGAQQRNFVRWNILGKYIKRNPKPYPSTYAAEIDTVKNWIANRLAWLDNDLGTCTEGLVTKNALRNNIGFAQEGKIDNIYPSPFKDQLTVTLNIPESEIATIQLMDMNGIVVYKKIYTLQKGNQLIQLNLKEKQLTSGVYLLNINGTNTNITKKVFKE